jgi:gamma-glutamylaminecyclotransferase
MKDLASKELFPVSERGSSWSDPTTSQVASDQNGSTGPLRSRVHDDEEMSARVPLFVYGTLMRECVNHAELCGARFVGIARTAPAYAVVEVAGFPALVPGKGVVSGELFDVDAPLLERLDLFEGNAYRRGNIVLDGGELAEAYLLAADWVT